MHDKLSATAVQKHLKRLKSIEREHIQVMVITSRGLPDPENPNHTVVLFRTHIASDGGANPTNESTPA